MSARYTVAACLLLGVALVPTIIHSYARLTIADTWQTSAIPKTLAGYTSSPSGRNARWGKRRFGSDDWTERKYTSGSRALRLTVIRSYDLKTLYHHPELAVAYHEGHTFQPARTQRFTTNEAVPVHVLHAIPPDTALSMYALYYDGRFVENPIAFQLRTAGELLFSGRKAMTLFFIQDDGMPANGDLAAADATRVLFAAIDGFLAQGTVAAR